MSDLAQLEAELAAGWPAPWWPQDDPKVRRQRFPERCKRGHLLEPAALKWRLIRGRYVTYQCPTCDLCFLRGLLGPGVNEEHPEIRSQVAQAAIRKQGTGWCRRGHRKAGTNLRPNGSCRICQQLNRMGVVGGGLDETNPARIREIREVSRRLIERNRSLAE